MSNLRSIAEGTFVLGDTNNLAFQAGPGIKIDSPSEGTVRIANDETVLWENSNGSTSATTSESVYNFQYADFYISCVASNNTEIMPVRYRVKIVSGKNRVAFGGSYFDGSATRTAQIGLAIDGTLSFLSNSSGGYSNKIYKVVGINRIKGGK